MRFPLRIAPGRDTPTASGLEETDIRPIRKFSKALSSKRILDTQRRKEEWLQAAIQQRQKLTAEPSHVRTCDASEDKGASTFYKAPSSVWIPSLEFSWPEFIALGGIELWDSYSIPGINIAPTPFPLYPCRQSSILAPL
jgi:hypothetical protein